MVGSYELLMMVIRGSQVPAGGTPAAGRDADLLQEQAAELFAGQLAAARVPSVRAIRAQLGRCRSSPREIRLIVLGSGAAYGW